MTKIEVIQRSENDEKRRKAIMKRFSQKDASELFNKLKVVAEEKDVENAWRDAFTSYYTAEQGYQISSPEKVDGFITASSGSIAVALRILLEFKDKTDLTKNYDRARITCQCVHYMYNFKQKGIELPKVIVGADENQAFVLLASNFYKYLDSENYNWECAASSAYKEDPELMADLQQDCNLSVYPFQFVGSNFKERYNALIDLFDSIDSMTRAKGSETYKVTVSPATIVGMFDEFTRIAFREPEKINPVQAVNIFMQMLVGKNNEDYYFIPNNHNLYHLPGDKKIGVYGVQLESYFNHYDRNFSSKEIDQLTAIADRLIEATERRYKGDFWTPSIWAERADELMQEVIDNNYKENSIVWDCAAGVRNLTRDFSYNDLYISTYHQDEIFLGEGYNPEAKEAFQYDFLNDDIGLNLQHNSDPDDWKMPNKLFNALVEAGKSGKRVVFYTNPPYGTANNVYADGSSKKGIAKTKVNEEMLAKGLGKASQQLYCQFMARIIDIVNIFNLKNVYIGFFTKARFFAGGEYFKKFNNYFFNKFKFVKGILLSAGEFNDTADTWPITFSIYALNKENEPIPNSAVFSIEETEFNTLGKLETVSIEKHTVHKVYKSDSLSKWVREPLAELKTKNMNTNTYPQLSSALTESKNKKPSGKLYENSLGYMVSNSNNIGEGTTNSGVWLVSASAYKGHGFNVMPENFERACVNFAARRAITPKWYNDQDNYHYPDMNSNVYDEFVNDSIVFTLFENASYQAAYRNPKWSNTIVQGRWANQWFWLTLDEVKEEVEDNPKLVSIYDDMRGDQDRFVALEIKKRNFSNEAKEVLRLAKLVWKDTLTKRPLMFDDFPEYYLNAWDAGWFQIKKINERYPSKHYQEFKIAFQKLKEKISKNVYRLGML